MDSLLLAKFGVSGLGSKIQIYEMEKTSCIKAEVLNMSSKGLWLRREGAAFFWVLIRAQGVLVELRRG